MDNGIFHICVNIREKTQKNGEYSDTPCNTEELDATFVRFHIPSLLETTGLPPACTGHT